jgi:hypothetical protein
MTSEEWDSLCKEHPQQAVPLLQQQLQDLDDVTNIIAAAGLLPKPIRLQLKSQAQVSTTQLIRALQAFQAFLLELEEP